MKKWQVFLFVTLVIAILGMSGCMEERDFTENVLPLNESVEAVNGVFPTMSEVYKDYTVTRGRIVGTNMTRRSGNYCENDWEIYFDDGARLAVRGLDCHPNLIGGINRIVTQHSWHDGIYRLTFKK